MGYVGSNPKRNFVMRQKIDAEFFADVGLYTFQKIPLVQKCFYEMLECLYDYNSKE